ncbi:hypothetical protein pb186bvf_005079 [Paramecium bursaria]
MLQNNKQKCQEHNKIGEGIEINNNSNKIYCAQCQQISKSFSIQQYSENKVKQYISMQRERYQQLKQFRQQNYIQKKKFLYQTNFIDKESPQVQEQKQDIKKENKSNDKCEGQCMVQQLECQFLSNLTKYLYNLPLYNSYISYRTNWIYQQNQDFKSIMALYHQLYMVYSLQINRDYKMKNGYYVIFNNAFIMDGYFVDGQLQYGIILTDNQGKIDVNKNIKDLKVNFIDDLPFSLPFTVEQLNRYKQQHFKFVMEHNQQIYQ